MAICGKGAGKLLGFVIDRQPVGGHDAQGGPGAHDLQLGDPWEGQHGAARDIAHDLGFLTGVEPDILLTAAEHDRAFLRLTQAAERQRPNAARAFGDEDLAALRPHRRG